MGGVYMYVSVVEPVTHAIVVDITARTIICLFSLLNLKKLLRNV